MADMGVGEALLISSLISAGTAGVQASMAHDQAKGALWEQKQAQAAAEVKQKEADDKAEKQRLEALAANMEATGYGNVWGVDSNKYADAAQKLSAGTGDFNTDDDEDNPFYYRGLL